MEKQALISSKLKNALIGVILLYGLCLISRHNYLLFHSISEIFSIVIACGIFMVAWNSRYIAKNNYMLFIGIAYLFIAFLDFMHTLAYKGMGVFQGHGINAAVQLWISTRTMESISLVAAPLLIGRNIRARNIFTAYTVFTSLLMGTIFYWDIFPVCFIEGSGLTPFKKISEYVISLTLGLSIFVLYKKKKKFDKTVFRLLTASIFVTILSELSFTFYIDLYGLSNVAGHYFKIVSFYLIYKAIIESGLMKPYDLLFRDLKQSEEMLRKSEERHRSLIEQAGDAMFLLDLNGKFLEVNNRACEYLGYTEKELLSMSVTDVDRIYSGELFNKFTKKLRKNKPVTIELVLQRKDRTTFPAEIRSALIEIQNRLHLLLLVRDITERKKAENELLAKQNLNTLLIDSLPYPAMLIHKDKTILTANLKAKEAGAVPGDYCWQGFGHCEFIGEEDKKFISAHGRAPDNGTQCSFCEADNALKRNAPLKSEVIAWNKTWDTYWIPLSNDAYLHYAQDITERKTMEEKQEKLRQRLEAQWKIARMVDVDLTTLYDHVLSEIVNMTGSTYGFFGLLSDDESTMTTHAWSTEVMKNCRMQEPSFTFPVEQAGLWGNAIRRRKPIIVNNYEDCDHHNKKGIPAGHVPITNFISIPVFRQDRIVGIGAVANKSADYTAEEVQQVEAFLQSAQIIIEKTQAEDELARHREHLMELVEERTSELQQLNRDLEQEIAERIRADKQMKLMALFTELNPSPVLRFNIHGEVLMANKAAMDTLNISSIQEVRIKSLLPDMEKLDLMNCIYKGEILSHTAQIGDRYYHFIIKGLPELGFGQIYSTDVTEQKRAETETMRASHLASIGELAAGVAHEINNPINGIINYTQILANKSAPDSRELDIASRIIREGDRIANIVSNLLSFARDGREKPQPVHISDIISDSLALTATQIRKDSIRLNVDIREPLPLILASPQQIQQVLLNLISNARHALNEKFPNEHEEKALDIIAEKISRDHTPCVRVTIHDRGKGISDDIINKVTNPFFTTKPTGIGTGLGLSISHGIITDHDGSISIDSTEGEFTKVIVELPANNDNRTK